MQRITLILAALFGIGFFLESVDNKGAFLKDTANRIIPAKEQKPIDIKQEIARSQEQYVSAANKVNTASTAGRENEE